jgi:capsular polysaccharide transport system permease protein
VNAPLETKGPAVNTVRELRRLRARRLVRRLGLGVVLPTILATLYYGVLVTPKYESVSSFTVQSADAPAAPQLELIFASVPGNAGRDAQLVREHALSRDMLDHLIENHGFVEHYADESVDFMSRLDPSDGSEAVHEYYLEHFECEYDSAAGLLKLRVLAFDADSAQRFAQAILDKSEAMVNDLSARARTDRTALAQEELERAEGRLAAARTALTEAQSEGEELDPVQSAAALYELRAQLEAQLASARAELSALRGTSATGSPEMVAQQRRVSALRRQLEDQNERLAGESGASLRAAISRFEPLVVEKEFAERAYASALSSLEMARVDAARQHRYLVTLADPSHPSDATHPNVLWSVLTFLVLCFAVMGIGTLLVASVREHANV